MQMTATVKSPAKLDSWVSFLRAHAAITRELSVQLQREHGLTLNDYEVLLHLSHAEGARLRRVDLAERVILTASGITRLLEGLEQSGYVSKETCSSDARVSYAKLTDEGRAKLRAAGATHLRGIDELFVGRYSGSELATLADLLSRLPMTGSEASSCT
jgi:DNA-binding MarR family transcriptional regulator